MKRDDESLSTTFHMTSVLGKWGGHRKVVLGPQILLFFNRIKIRKIGEST